MFQYTVIFISTINANSGFASAFVNDILIFSNLYGVQQVSIAMARFFNRILPNMCSIFASIEETSDGVESEPKHILIFLHVLTGN